MDDGASYIEAFKKKLLEESKEYTYPVKKEDVRKRYRGTSFELHKRWKERDSPFNFLSFGSRRSSTVSNYGNTPIVMRRSISSNGELAPYMQSVAHCGSLRGVPANLADYETKTSAHYGSLRGLPLGKRLSKFDEVEEEQDLRRSGWREEEQDDKDGLSVGADRRRRDNWDTASVDAGTKTKGKDKTLGLFQRNNKEAHNDKDKWRGNEFSPEKKGKNVDEKLKELKLGEVRKSSESLISVKRKKHWWFRRRKSSKELVVPVEEETCEDNINGKESVTLSDRAISDIGLNVPVPEDNRSLHDELHKNQILLKGYSQRTVAGMNLNHRLSGTNQMVTSRASLTGSDILISDSSKSFMQYDLPRSKDYGCKPSMADKIREGKSYEEQYEMSLRGSTLGSTDHLSACSSEALLEDNSSSSVRLKNQNQIGAAEVYLRVGGQRDNSSSREGMLFSCSLPHVDVDAVCASSSGKKQEESLTTMFDQLHETNIDEALNGHSSPVNSEISAAATHQLSPDSRPIRPMQPSVLVPSPPMLRHHVTKSASALGQEAYPHSLLDRPVSTRLIAKRLSSSGAEQPEEIDSDILSKKTNIAYTLTFQEKPICVNVRTKSQSVTPEPYSTPLSSNSPPGPRRLSSDRSSSKGIHDTVAVGFERQYSGVDDRETSPGYRLAYANIPMRSPTLIRRSVRKNPKVQREKDKLAIANSWQHSAEETEFRSAQSSPLAVSESSHHKQNGDAASDTGDIIKEHVLQGKSDNVQSVHVTCSADYFTYDNVFIDDEVTGDQADIPEEKPACNLQRRNTFTLSNASENLNGVVKTDHVNGGEDKENKVSTIIITNINVHNQHIAVSKPVIEDSPSPGVPELFTGQSKYSRVANTDSSGCDSALISHEATPGVRKDSPNLGKSSVSGGSRIPVRRGGAPEGRTSGSRIPTMSGHQVPTTPERSSQRGRLSSSTCSQGGTPTLGSGLPSPVYGISAVASASGIPGLSPVSSSGRKGSIADSSVAAKLGVATNLMTTNFLKTENNTIVVKRETILQIVPEATSKCAASG